VLSDEKELRTDKYEEEWNGFWRFYNLMQFLDEFIAVSSIGMRNGCYYELPIIGDNMSVLADEVPQTDNAWNEIRELLFDDEAKEFVDYAKSVGIPAPSDDYIGYEVEGDDGEVIATVEIAWPAKRIGFMTTEQVVDRERLERLGWKILNSIDAVNIDVGSLFGGDN